MSRIKFSQLIPAVQTDLDNDTIFAIVNLGVSKKTTINEVKNYLVSQGIATQSYVGTSISTAIADLVGTAPDVLNTLEELANAINNQADFATGIKTYVDTKVAELFGLKTTDDLAEGITNKYFTESRARTSISVTDPSGALTYDAGTGIISFNFGAVALVTSVNGEVGDVVLDTDDVNEGVNNRYFTETRSRLSIGVIDPTDILVYDSNTGLITFNPDMLVRSVNGQIGFVTLDTDDVAEGLANLYYTDARSRLAISTSDPNGYLTYNNTTGVISLALPVLVTAVNGKTGNVILNTDDVSEGVTNLYFTTARSRSAISVVDPMNRLAYNSTTGVLTFTANGLVTSVAGRSGDVVLNTDDVAEGANLYFTTARARQSVSAGLGVHYNNTTGVISIGQSVETTSSVTFNTVTVTGNTQSTSTTTGAVTVVGGVGIGGNLNVGGNINIGGTISHNGIIPTEGTNIDQIKTIVVNMRLEAEWLDTGINNGVLATGTYAIQLYADDTGVGGTNDNEYYSGIMSWYSGDPNSTDVQPTDEIPLHRAGGSNEGTLYLRTYRTLSADDKDLKLQIFSNYDVPAATDYIFKFRRLI